MTWLKFCAFQITVEDYVLALQVLTNDFRFTLYNVFYKRILLFWMMLGFVILLSLLLSGQLRFGFANIVSQLGI